MDDPKAVKGGKTEVDVEPVTDDKLSDESSETKEADKARKKANKEIGQKTASVKEEANKDVPFAGPYDKKTDAKDKNVAKNAARKKMKDMVKKVTKESADLSGHEVKPYEGPEHTVGPDGKPSARSKALSLVKSATKKLKHVKETQMLRSDKKFGVSESILNTVLSIVEADKNKSIDGAESAEKSEKDETKKVAKMKTMCPSCKKSPCECVKEEKSCGCGGNCKCSTNEELKGKQKKLDKNHNGKLDSQDFKILRGKKMKEEVKLSAEELARIEEIAKGLE